MKILFKLKDPCICPACKIYKAVCICGEKYIRETIHNVETRNTLSDKSNLSKHINSHLDHTFVWSIICNAPTKKIQTKDNRNFIAIIKPTLNDQLDSGL